MPISHPHKAIFVHIPRACGSSIETALGVYGLQNDGFNYPYPAALFGRHRGILLQHLVITEIRERIDPEMFDRYFKFTVVRNPYDRIVSEFRWSEDAKRMSLREFVLDLVAPSQTRAMQLYRTRIDRHRFRGHRRRLPFRRFLEEIAIPNHDRPLELDMDRHFKSQTAFLTDGEGRCLVDFVARYENLEEDFGTVCGRLGLDADLSGINASQHDAYPAYYDDETREIVGRLYRQDLDRFGYRF